MIPIDYYLTLAAFVFSLGLLGLVINRNNVLILLMCIELLLLAVNINFIVFAHYFRDLTGQIIVFFILAVAAVEAAVGLSILMVLFRSRCSIETDLLNHLRG